jgi:hypothetical protein
VTAEGVRGLAQKTFKKDSLALAIVGGVDKEDIDEGLLKI